MEMETAVPESSETNNVDSSVPELPSKPEVVEEVGDKETKTENGEEKGTGDKELSWENLAAQIATEDGENQTQIGAEVPPTEPEPKTEDVESGSQETVINSVTDEKTVTESDASEVVPESAEPETNETVNVSSKGGNSGAEVGETQISEETTPVEEVLEPANEVLEPRVEEAIQPPAEEIADSTVAEPVKEVAEAVKEVAEAVVEEVSESAVEEIEEPKVKEIAEPVIEKVAEPVVEEVAEPVVEEVAEPVVEEVAEPVVEEVAEPVVEEVEETVEDVKPVANEVTRSVVNEIVESFDEEEIPEPVVEAVALPVEEISETVEPETIPAIEVTEASASEEEEMVLQESIEETSTPEKPKKEAAIEISELKPEETVETAETLEDIEYTVLEAEEVETNEIIEEHLAQTNNATKGVTETVVIINPDQSQTEITIQQVDDDDRTDESQSSFTEEIYLVTNKEESVDDPPKETIREMKPKKQRGRKPISDIPLHVLGRDISKPTEGVSNGGRTMPKPRLGVKVPYRNLTSQIVSKQEIEKEIMERFKLKQEQNVTNSGDILFARKLTQRLAKKLIPTEKDPEQRPTKEVAASTSVRPKPSSDIKNNSDLIAILEGDGDDIDLERQNRLQEAAKKTEKEIALEQLKELPGKSNKIYKSKSEEEKKVEKTPQKEKESPKPKQSPSTPSPQKPSVEKKEKPQVDMEPRLKTGMVIKTYTRKRKSTDLDIILPPKRTVVAATPIRSEDGSPGNVYITKSSRVIKRKVIWDPDETPSKIPLKTPKVEPGVKSPVKPVEKEKKEPTEKTQEKKVLSPVKKVIAKTSPIKKPKRLTEVDKLLMDEGAVNMLYDVKTNDDTSPDKPKKKNNKSTISLDKAHKELMSKTNVIKNDLQQNTIKDVQKSLRKKEIVSPPTKKEMKKETTPTSLPRKKSKDSIRSSVHSPPSSPPYNAAEASRIIRRHSSSSFSSNDELDEESGEEKSSKKKATTSESPKKKVKKTTETKPVKESPKNNNNTVTVPETKVVNHVDKTGPYKAFAINKRNKLVSIKLQSVDGRCYFSEQVLKDLITCLKDYGKDDDCHVVSITSDNNESFCEGLDYRLLVTDDETSLKKKANELASLVKEFLRCLLNFPKVLVAGIQGDCVGLAVTMLPLFDMVIASDTSTFSAPYSRLGCVPEAGFLLGIPYLSSNGLASEILFASQTIKADDAFRRGLVSRLCWPEKYQQELKSLLSQVANQSRESIVATKQQLRQNILQSTETALSSVSKVLVEYWTSPECQKNFAK